MLVIAFSSWFICFLLDTNWFQFLSPTFRDLLIVPLMLLFFVDYIFYGFMLIPLNILNILSSGDMHNGPIFNGYFGGNFFELPSLTFLGFVLFLLIWFIVGFIISYIRNKIA